MSDQEPAGWQTVSKERIRRVRQARENVERSLPNNRRTLEKRLKKGDTVEEANSKYPKGKELAVDIKKAEIRKRVSEVLYEEDTRGYSEDSSGVIERQIHRYYDYEIQDPTLRGHIDAPHAAKPPADLEKLCKAKSIITDEPHTDAIARIASNWMVCKKSRVQANADALPGSVLSEGTVYTKEDSLNVVKAKRDLTQKMLEEQNNITEDGKAKNPYLAIYCHGKTDKRGHDIEIAAKLKKDGRGPLDPRLAFWVQEKLRTKIGEAGIKIKNQSEEREPTINVVTFAAAYSGSGSLIPLRYGDDVFDFKGFGEMLQALQLELGSAFRQQHHEEIGKILASLLQDFSDEFKTPEDLQKLEIYRSAYEDKLAKEKSEFLSKEKVFFNPEMPEESIAMIVSVRNELEVRIGDKVKIIGSDGRKHNVSVVNLSPAQARSSGKTMMLHSKFEPLIDKDINIEKNTASDS